MTNQTNTRDITTGINGSGAPVWIVTTVRGSKVLGMEIFASKAEAINWMQWA
jgi:hypothetical protein